MKTIAAVLLFPFLSFSQTPPAAPATPPKAAPKRAPAAPRAQQAAPAAPRAQQTAPAAPRQTVQPQPRYAAPAVQPRYAAPRALPATNVMPRMRNGLPLTREVVIARPHTIFSAAVRSSAYSPGFVLRVDEAPPAPPLYSLAVRPNGVGYVFIPGYWFWADGEYTWIDPLWGLPPVEGAVWISPQWVVQDDGTWALQEGYWMDPNQDQQ